MPVRFEIRSSTPGFFSVVSSAGGVSAAVAAGLSCAVTAYPPASNNSHSFTSSTWPTVVFVPGGKLPFGPQYWFFSSITSPFFSFIFIPNYLSRYHWNNNTFLVGPRRGVIGHDFICQKILHARRAAGQKDRGSRIRFGIGILGNASRHRPGAGRDRLAVGQYVRPVERIVHHISRVFSFNIFHQFTVRLNWSTTIVRLLFALTVRLPPRTST